MRYRVSHTIEAHFTIWRVAGYATACFLLGAAVALIAVASH